MTRRRRSISDEDAAIWDRVKNTARPLHPEKRAKSVPVKLTPPKRAEVKEPAKFSIPKFEMGAKSTASRPVHDVLPPIADRVSSAPIQMDRKAYGKLVRGKLSPEARIDLHGMNLASAHPRLINFVLGAHADGARLVLVITGKGRASADDGPIPTRAGVLRHQVPHWLSMPPLGPIVLQVTPAHRSHGGIGAYYVYLRRGR